MDSHKGSATEAGIAGPDGRAGIRRSIAAHRRTSRGAAHARARARPFWIMDMSRPLTERSTNAAKLEAPLPPEFPEAFQRLVDERNRNARSNLKPIYARDLYEEAIGELVHLANCGRVTFIATPFRDYVRKAFWIDQALKAGVERLALAHGITRSVVVVTAFQHYLDRHGALQKPAILVGSVIPKSYGWTT